MLELSSCEVGLTKAKCANRHFCDTTQHNRSKLRIVRQKTVPYRAIVGDVFVLCLRLSCTVPCLRTRNRIFIVILYYTINYSGRSEPFQSFIKSISWLLLKYLLVQRSSLCLIPGKNTFPSKMPSTYSYTPNKQERVLSRKWLER